MGMLECNTASASEVAGAMDWNWMDEQSAPRGPSSWPRPRPLTPFAGEGMSFISSVVISSPGGGGRVQATQSHTVATRRSHLVKARSNSIPHNPGPRRNLAVPWSSATAPCAPPASPSRLTAAAALNAWVCSRGQGRFWREPWILPRAAARSHASSLGDDDPVQRVAETTSTPGSTSHHRRRPRLGSCVRGFPCKILETQTAYTDALYMP
jgi:predicted component of type VI protein secretion system